ncbi:hypothetical protein G7Y89_g8912 [Cudoniella acicularis]|uniref:Sulfatase N-terminal domain-containing protein n=1 Tax=Cudoniella acicularis TaxID=354080 RepID=A0A8H4RFP7_9HELO|nr:hypothetical protein G7Y89_g8912 [Cudoniella acicularis]
MTEYGFLEPPEFVPKFGAGNDTLKDEGIFGRLFYRGLRDPDKAMGYDDAVVRSAITWLKCPPNDKPWVLFMPLLFPHCPFQVEEPYFSMYDRSKMAELSLNIDLKTGYEPRYMKTIRERYGIGRATPEIWAEIKATYYGIISRLDDQFGRLVKAIEDHRYGDNTVTIFFTDYGEYLGNHGLIEKWLSGLSDSLVYEPLIIVPVLVNGATSHKKFACSEGGVLTSEEPLLEQAPYSYDIKAGLQHEDTTLVGKAISIRNEEWTYIYRLYEPSELYHRQNDPQELHNLAADPEDTAISNMLEGEKFGWLMEGSDILPWAKDNRFPEVTLKSHREQMEERLKKAGGAE